METRGYRQNYFTLNDGYDSEVLPEDQLSRSPTYGPSSNPIFGQRELDSFIDIGDVEVFTFDSVSQSTRQPGVDSSIVSTRSSEDIALPSVCPHTDKKKAWFWEYFTQKETTDTRIQCSIVDERTGIVCNWYASDSKRHASTSNMTNHLLRKHSIEGPDALPSEPVKNKHRATLSGLWGGKVRENLTHQQLLERNILRCVITNKQPSQLLNRQHSSRFFRIFQEYHFLSLPAILFGSG
ncbi:hypothetical protein V1527DRAFT_402862 [Lipomyces starkeyi]